MDKTHTTVHVAGQDFRLSGTDSEAYIRQIADYVNQKIDEVQRAYPTLSTGNCVILAALNLSDCISCGRIIMPWIPASAS